MRRLRCWTDLGVLIALALPATAQVEPLHALDDPSVAPDLGRTLVRWHDLDGDGWREFLAPGTQRVIALSGRYLATGTGPAIEGSIPTPGSWNDASLIGLADYNGDGAWDFAVGDPEHLTSSYYKTGRVSLWDAQGTLLGRIAGPTQGENLGRSMALLGDLNGDGFKDLLIGSPRFTGGIPTVPYCGKACVYSGKMLLQNTAVVLRAHLGQVTNEDFGETLATGYFDGDSVVDYAIGAPSRPSPGGMPHSGRVSIYSGATGALYRTIYGPAGSHFGSQLSSGLDVTGDGRHDLVIGAPGADSVNGANAGSVYLYSGAGLVGSGLLLPLQTWHGPSPGALLGSAVAIVQDIDGDGRADVLAGAPYFEPVFFGNGNGMFACYSGKTGALIGNRLGASGEHLGTAFVSADTWNTEPGWEFLAGSLSIGRAASFTILP